MNITTERLILRSWQEGDAADLYMLARDVDIGPRAGWKPHDSIAVSLKTIRTILAGPEVYAITDKMGFWIGKPYWGRGFVPEAARAALRHAFTELSCASVWCTHFDENEQSRRVIEKCRFTRMPELDHRDSLADGVVHLLRVYRMTAEEWRERHG